MKAMIKKNDLFYTSWGYDQTNYDYIIVCAVSPTGKTATCQRAEVKRIGHDVQCDIEKPIPVGYGNTFRMKVFNWYDGREGLKGSYIFCNDSKRKDIFQRVQENDKFYPTDCYSGH